jgi:hypothetical protein
MNHFKTLIAGGIAVAALLPAAANAGLILDTGTPSSSNGTDTLSTSQFFAAEFAVTAGETITDLSAYLASGAGGLGSTFTFDIYSNSIVGHTPSSLATSQLVYTATGTLSVNGGWNTTAVSWTPSASGDYWLALQVASVSDTAGLDVPLEPSATNGTANALAFAYYGSNTFGKYTSSGAPEIGLQVTAVPLPPSLWLLGGSLALLGLAARRTRAAGPLAA